MHLGCIGDDFTGSSDLGNTLAKAGMRTVQYVGTPSSPARPDVEAGVVALKSRSIPADEAIRLSLEALEWLKAQGCSQFLFKYCSTFDSTPDGNIGPVAEALAEVLEVRKVLFCPAFPEAGRSVYLGHLFVGDQLLNESGLENHPLNPMSDANLCRWLGHQAKGSVGLLPAPIVQLGVEASRNHLTKLDQQGHRLIVADAISNDDLLTLGQAAAELPLITGGSGIAMGLPANFRSRNLLSGSGTSWQAQTGRAAVLSGSCSKATRGQVAAHSKIHPAFEITANAVMNGTVTAATITDWILAQEGLPLAYSSADAATVAAAQEMYGAAEIAGRMEALLADVANNLVAGGTSRLITAGGETSGAVVEGLALGELQIGPEIDPGVPVMRAHDDLVLALKSGNFGAEDFFEKAASTMASEA